MSISLKPVPGATKPTNEDVQNLINKTPFPLAQDYIKLLSSLSTSYFEDLVIRLNLADGTSTFLYLIYGAKSLDGMLGMRPNIGKDDIIVFGRDSFGRDILVDRAGKLEVFHSRKEISVSVEESLEYVLKKLNELFELNSVSH